MKGVKATIAIIEVKLNQTKYLSFLKPTAINQIPQSNDRRKLPSPKREAYLIISLKMVKSEGAELFYRR